MKKIFTVTFLLYCCLALQAQDAIFSQFYATPLITNPAFAGSTFAPRFSVIYRNQWLNVPNAYGTMALSYDQYIDNLNSGFGFQVLNDNAGDGTLQTNFASAHYAYRIKANKRTSLKIGIEAGVGQKNIDWNRLVFLDMIDPTSGGSTIPSKEVAPQNFSQSYFDVSSGFLVYNPNWYAGLSLKHLNTPNQSFLNNKATLNQGLPLLMSLHGGYQIVLSRSRKAITSFITPNILAIKQGDFYQVNVGAQAGFGSVFGGLAFRHAVRNSDAVIINAGWKRGIFKINYSHDVTINGLRNSFGAHEISMMLNLDELKNNKPKQMDCFDFMR
jgi:type IX secretion system PorP/SprF family membrane protein